MKFNELKKAYQYDDRQKAFILNVQLEDYRDAYSNWDFSPFVNRDLDDDLSEYLLECSYEIPSKYPLVLNFHIRNYIYNALREDKSIIGMHNFFKYQIKRINNYRLRVIKDIFTFLAIGSILLLAGFYSAGFSEYSLINELVSEGLYIGGWVMLWEVFSAWFFDMKKAANKRKQFRRLDGSRITYSYDCK